MRIGIDARPLQAETRFRGIGKALENLLLATRNLKLNDIKLVLFIDKSSPAPEILRLFPGAELIYVKSSRLRKLKYLRVIYSPFKAIRPRKGSVDVLLQYDVNLGVPTSVPTVVMFHDIIPLLFRGEEIKAEAGNRSWPLNLKRILGREIHWKKYIRSLDQYKKAAHIIAISKSSKQDLIKHITGINPQGITVIYLGSGGKVAPKINQVSSSTKKLVLKPYLLYVGGIDVRKNIRFLLEEFIKLHGLHPELNLILIGKEFGLQDQLNAIGWNKVLRDNPSAAKHVITPGFLSDEDVSYLYTKALAFIFPSRYEGFGMPVIEAMSLGCPVIAFSNSSIPEVSGKAALLLAKDDSIVPSVNKLIQEKELRDSLVELGLKQSKKFTWDKTARQTLDVLKTIPRE